MINNNEYNEKFSVFLDEFQKYDSKIQSKIGIMVVFLIVCCLIGAYRRAKDKFLEKSVTLYILDSQYASELEGVTENGKLFEDKKIKGLYCLRWTFSSVHSEETLAKYREMYGQIGMDVSEDFSHKYWAIVIETDGGWYYCRYSKGKLLPWNSIDEIVNGDKNISIKVKVMVLDKKEIEYLEADSKIVKLYQKTFGNTDGTPALLTLNFLK